MNNNNYLSKQYNFYNRYHKNYINKRIHIVCIPVLLWSGFVFLSYVNIDIDVNVDKLPVLSCKLLLGSYEIDAIYLCFGIVDFNGASILATFYTSYYLVLNFKLGLLMYFILYFMQISSYYFYINVDNAWQIAGLAHIFAWMLQFIGHGIFEKNAPALKDNLIQSFLTAPIFVLIDVIS